MSEQIFVSPDDQDRVDDAVKAALSATTTAMDLIFDVDTLMPNVSVDGVLCNEALKHLKIAQEMLHGLTAITATRKVDELVDDIADEDTARDGQWELRGEAAKNVSGSYYCMKHAQLLQTITLGELGCLGGGSFDDCSSRAVLVGEVTGTEEDADSIFQNGRWYCKRHGIRLWLMDYIEGSNSVRCSNPNSLCLNNRTLGSEPHLYYQHQGEARVPGQTEPFQAPEGMRIYWWCHKHPLWSPMVKSDDDPTLMVCTSGHKGSGNDREELTPCDVRRKLIPGVEEPSILRYRFTGAASDGPNGNMICYQHTSEIKKDGMVSKCYKYDECQSSVTDVWFEMVEARDRQA